MLPLFRKFLGLNWILLALTLALAGFGLFAIYSATWMREDAYLADSWRRQLAWIGVGMVVYMVISLTDYRWVRWGAVPFYLFGLAALVLCELKGTTVYGAKSWLRLGPLNFQPSQPAILAGIMVLAIVLSQFRRLHPFLRIVLGGAAVAAPWLMILKQPDLGSAIVWVPVFLVMLYVGGLPMRYLLVLILLGLILIPIVVNFGLKGYQRDRITTFLHPDRDPQGDGWTINQSLTAIGSGGWAGKGFKAENTLNELGFLPSTIVHNDFIFAVIGEQHGFMGGVMLLGAFAALLLTLILIGHFARDDLGRLLVGGTIGMLFAHVFMNIGMTISVTPITGLPLPLISYGGSFALVVLVSLGIAQSVWIHRHELPH